MQESGWRAILRLLSVRSTGPTARLLGHHEGQFPLARSWPSSLVAPETPVTDAAGLDRCYHYCRLIAGLSRTHNLVQLGARVNALRRKILFLLLLCTVNVTECQPVRKERPMSRIRSPGYPGISLRKAIDIVDKLFSRVRNNTVDREAAVKDLGYYGLTGQSQKILSDLAHFNLVEKSGKGGIRVTDLAARILHPHNQKERAAALREAAYSPELFAQFKANWPDGHVSENALRAWLMRSGFSSVAIHPVIRSFMETYAFLQQESATESYDEPQQVALNPVERADADAGIQLPAIRPSSESWQFVGSPLSSGVRTMSGERVVFVEESGPDQYLKLVAAGQMDASLLEALEDFVKRQKKRLQSQSS